MFLHLLGGLQEQLSELISESVVAFFCRLTYLFDFIILVKQKCDKLTRSGIHTFQSQPPWVGRSILKSLKAFQKLPWIKC